MALRCLLLFLLIFNISQESQSKKTPNKPAKLHILPGRLVPRFDYLRSCNESSPLALVISNVHIRNLPTNEIVIDVDHFANRQITVAKAVMTIYNCEDSASWKCPLFHTWRFGKEFCAMMTKTKMLWTPILDNMHPPMTCPLPPGPYLLRNGTIDMRIFQAIQIPVEKYYWRVRLELFDPELFYCSTAGVQFYRSFL